MDRREFLRAACAVAAGVSVPAAGGVDLVLSNPGGVSQVWRNMPYKMVDGEEVLVVANDGKSARWEVIYQTHPFNDHMR